VAIEGDELEVLAGVEEAAVVLAEPFAVGPELHAVALAPVPLQIVGPPRAGEVVELAEDAVGRDGGEVRPISGYSGRVVGGSPFEVGRQPVESAEQEQRAGHLEQRETPVGSPGQIALKRDQGRVAVSHFALDPAARQQHFGPRGRVGPGPPKRVQRHVELDVHPLPQGGVRQVHQAAIEAGVHLRRLGVRHRGTGERVLAQHGLDAGDERDLRVTHPVLGGTHAVPAVGPGRLEVDGPLEFGGGVLIVRLATQLAQPQ
jgi:hypothetical protein